MTTPDEDLDDAAATIADALEGWRATEGVKRRGSARQFPTCAEFAELLCGLGWTPPARPPALTSDPPNDPAIDHKPE